MKKEIMGLFAIGLLLSGCGASLSNDEIQTQLTTQVDKIDNYHLTLQQTETKNGDATTTTQVIANASVWNDGRGFGTRIDKTDGKATNQMEVVADTNSGAIRYYQDQWQSSLTAQSSLQSVVGFPYKNVVELLSDIHSLASWNSNGTLTYEGQDSNVRQALAKLGVTVNENVVIQMTATLNREKNRIEYFELKTTDNESKITREYRVNYRGFNEQKMRAVPEVPAPKKNVNPS